MTSNLDFYEVLIHLLINTSGFNLDYYLRNFIENRIKTKTETLLNSQLKKSKLKTSSNRIYMKIDFNRRFTCR